MSSAVTGDVTARLAKEDFAKTRLKAELESFFSLEPSITGSVTMSYTSVVAIATWTFASIIIRPCAMGRKLCVM